MGFTKELILLSLMILLTFNSCKGKEAEKNVFVSSELNELSENLLLYIKVGKNVEHLTKKLENTSIEVLQTSLATDAERYAFWINIYNAYIQLVLKENPESYNDKGSFFSKEQIKIAGQKLSFDKIEHGILRKSQWKLGLGYFRKWFPNKLERKLRVRERDFRIHFALNCGAKDCPPVGIYTPKNLNEQLEKSTQIYLEKTTELDSTTKKAVITPLFSWFRGDFGGKSGVLNILKSYNILENTKGVGLTYKDYDWTLDLDNFIEL